MRLNQTSGRNRTGWILTALMPVLLTGLGVVLYAGAFKASFVFDDGLILNEPRLNWTRLSASRIIELTRITTENTSSRIIPNLTFGLNYYFGGDNVIGYRLFNLAVHVIASLLVFLVAGRIMARGCFRSPLAPAAAALLWLVHPLHIQSVTYVWQRMNSLAAMFYLLSFYLYILARERQLSASNKKTGAVWFFAGCATAGLLSLGSKQIALTLPLMLVAGELFFFQDLKFHRIRKIISGALLLTGAVIFLFLVYPGTTPLATLAATYDDKPFTMGQRLLTQPGVVVYYLSLIVWPHPDRLNLDVDFPLSTGLLTPAPTILALAALTALALVIVYAAQKRRLTAFALLWFLVTLVPESSIYGLDLMFAYRTYLPSVFIILALAGLLTNHRASTPSVIIRGSLRIGRLVPAGIAFMAVFIGGAWTIQHNRIWQNDFSLWQDTVRKSPAKARPRNNLGKAHALRDHLTEALSCFQQATTLEPEDMQYRHNLAVALTMIDETEQAEKLFKQIIALFPGAAETHYELGRLYFEKNNLDKAAAHYQQVIAGDPRFAKAYNDLGGVMLVQGRFREAVALFHMAIEIDPGLAAPHLNLADFYQPSSPRTALSHLVAVETIDPENPDIPMKISEILDRLGETDRAARFREKAAALMKKKPHRPDPPGYQSKGKK